MCLHRKDFGSLLLVVVTSTIAWPQEIVEYGRECAVKIAPIPAFDCREGVLVPITFNDRVPQSYPRHMTCDRPALLTYEATGADGQCVPYSRALVLRDDDRAQIAVACRQKKIRPADTVPYDDIDIIAHSVVTGSTCWFQAVAPEPLASDQGFDSDH